MPQYFSPSEITEVDILEICALKNQSWPHSMESQIAWWERNTDSDDLLVSLTSKGSILAFLRLRSREVSASGLKLKSMCVTEVCVDKSHRGRGFGLRLMNLADAWFRQTDSAIGYLLCQDIQKPFYEACGWHLTDDAQLQIESSSGVRRSLADNELCMTIDPQQRLNGPVVLFGDVF